MKPFDLDKALAGEPVRTRDGNEAIIIQQVKNKDVGEFLRVPIDSIIGFIEVNSQIINAAWNAKGENISHLNDNYDIIGMLSKPKRLINGVEVPEPVTMETWEDGAYYWYLNFYHSDFATKGQFYKDVVVH